jgi:hypothetical protein
MRIKWPFEMTGTLVAVFLLSTGIVKPAMKLVDVSFSMASPITLHEPVAVHVTIKNQTADVLTFDLGLNQQTAFHIVVIAPDGRQGELPLGVNRGMGSLALLKPRGKYSKVLVLNEWYPFDVEGDYRIRITLELPIVALGPEMQLTKSFDKWDHQIEKAVLDLTILPRNEAVLKETCETLLRKVHEAEQNPERSAAANELSYIKDPVAIPYLGKLAGEREEFPAIRGLQRIGTDEVWEAMIAVTKSEYDWIAASMAKDILREKLPTIRNPNIRKKVEAGIK